MGLKTFDRQIPLGCTRFTNLPSNCRLVTNPLDTCCQTPQCDPETTTTPPPFPIPTRKPSAVTGQRENYCVYSDGRRFKTGQQWKDNCQSCTCLDDTTGSLRCVDECPQYTNLPSNCVLETDPTNPCCKRPRCSGTTGSITGTRPPTGVTPKPGMTPKPGVTPKPGTPTGTTGSITGTGTVPVPGTQGSFTGVGVVPSSVGSITGTRNGCYYNGRIYSQGENWNDGCDYQCTCEDAIRGFYRCTEMCVTYPDLPSTCKLVNVIGQCCPTVNCQGTLPGGTTGTNPGGTGTGTLPGGTTGTNPGGTGTGIFPTGITGGGIIPGGIGTGTLPGGITGGGIIPGGTGTGTLPGGITGGGVIPGGSTGSITGYNSMCLYKNRLYNEGAKWNDGCQYECECTDGKMGFWKCRDLCPKYENLPSDCTLQTVAGECCRKPRCTNTPVNELIGTYPPALTGYRPGIIPGGNPSSTLGTITGIGGSTTGTGGSTTGTGGSITGTGGSTTGTGGSTTGVVIPGTVGGITGTRNGCVYNGKTYKQDESWSDGCQYDCQCLDAKTGQYSCREKCPSYTNYPSYCSLQTVPNQCCKKLVCSGPANIGSTTGTSTGTGTGTGGVRPCVDILPNCNEYNFAEACTGQYLGWAVKNCVKTCGLCDYLTTTPLPTDGCVNKLSNCDQFEDSACTGPYKAWAKANCPRRCGLCDELKPTTPSPDGCVDLIDCEPYTKSVCTNPTYIPWAKARCAKFCGFCGSGTGNSGSGTNSGGAGSGGITSGPGSGIISGGAGSGGITSGPGSGIISGGAGSGGITNGPGSGIISSGGSGSIINGQSGYCLYNGIQYTQGQTWRDKCLYSCTCTNALTGNYNCQTLCPQWQLPSICSLKPAPAGKCCPIPSCPSYITITYPGGLTEATLP
ncbi:mucin-19 [Lingula anatina]|uniref:Mucin-19 n=1 Tax=Lingula anatina TaxID=7574 RepID=A0A1S3HE86_LINAN|nr:mucin-19 [Lingula anatina]|eukprot:XP_013383816.1 mucin-19 [Lingula anatina]